MDKLEAMAMFVAATEEGSLAAAARRVGRSAASATRALALLEAYAGEELLVRSTRGLRLTPAGEQKLALWRDVLERLRDPRDERERGTVAGDLAITAPELFGRLQLMPLVEPFLVTHPGVRIRLHLLNRLVDLVREGLDVAIRLAPLRDSGLTAVNVGKIRRLTCASPDYLERHGVPRRPADLIRHLCIGLNPDASQELWSFANRGGGHRASRVTTRLSVNGAGAALDTALRGGGVVRVMSYQVAHHLEAGRLVSLLEAYEPEPSPVHALFRPQPSRRSPVRAFVDEVVPRLRVQLAELSARTLRTAPPGTTRSPTGRRTSP